MSENFICKSDQVAESSIGFNFYVDQAGVPNPAFVVRHNGTAYAYLNRCAHLALELDWEKGEFFDTSGDYLICSNHGAMFEPDTGECINGPCYGAFLIQLRVEETEEGVFLKEEGFQVANNP